MTHWVPYDVLAEFEKVKQQICVEPALYNILHYLARLSDQMLMLITESVHVRTCVKWECDLILFDKTCLISNYCCRLLLFTLNITTTSSLIRSHYHYDYDYHHRHRHHNQPSPRTILLRYNSKRQYSTVHNLRIHGLTFIGRANACLYLSVSLRESSRRRDGSEFEDSWRWRNQNLETNKREHTAIPNLHQNCCIPCPAVVFVSSGM